MRLTISKWDFLPFFILDNMCEPLILVHSGTEFKISFNQGESFLWKSTEILILTDGGGCNDL